MLAGIGFAAALLCAAIMGLAIQRGSTCTVAALEEWHATRRLTRLAAMVEASLWVCAGLLLARQCGLLTPLPRGYALSPWTLAGATLLGAGAVLNQACVFGTVARLGSGQWAFAATPMGFYLGCLSAGQVFAAPVPKALDTAPPLSSLPAWAAWVVLAIGLWRAASALSRRRGAITAPWSPHAATLVIGLAFLVLLIIAGEWAYTDVLAELARGMASGVAARSALCAALLVGALAGGRMTGKLQWGPLRLAQLLRCAGGGLLMGWGGQLIPGGNDGLVLLGMPMLWPYAWASFGVMLAVISVLLLALNRRRVGTDAGLKQASKP